MADQGALAPPPANVHVARVLSVKHYTERLFAFSCERPSALRFRSGEFVMIGLMDRAKPLLRAYSIASPAWDEKLDFYSVKVPNGPLTGKLQRIGIGDEILVGRKPTGTLVLDALTQGRRLLLFSTGTGIAPFASLIREPDTYERFDEVVLTHTCRAAAELAYGWDMVRAAQADPLVGEYASAKLRHVTSLTREHHSLTGRVTELVADGRLFALSSIPPLDPAYDRAMICGSAPMLHDTRALLEARGFEEGSNHEPGSFVVERAFAP